MKKFKEAIVQEFLSRVTFNEIGQKLNAMTPENKAAFATLCIEGSSQLAGRMRGICHEIAREHAQSKIDQITADGTISLTELTKILTFLK